MNYNFDTQVAKEYGVDCAIMIANFQFWIAKNKASGKYFYDGRFWTFGSSQAFVELFPFWNRRHIELILSKLIEKGVIIKGNYNQNTYDRTLWYAFTEESKWIYKKQEIHLQKNVNGITENRKSYIDNNKDIKKDNKIDNKTDNIYMLLGEFQNVKLTKEQVKKLINIYDWYFDDAIETLSAYLASKGDKYKSHYAVLGKHNWVWERVHKDPECGQRPCCLHIPDEKAEGGLRKETALEYYVRKYGWNLD